MERLKDTSESLQLLPVHALINLIQHSCSFNMHISTLRRLYCTINSIGVERNREKENTSRHIILQKGLQISIQPTAQNTKTPPPHNLQYRVQLIEDVLGF